MSKISGLSFTNPNLAALKYGRTMEVEAANKIFELSNGENSKN